MNRGIFMQEMWTAIRDWGSRQHIFSKISIIRWVALFYILWITLAEATTVLLKPQVGLVLHGFLLLVLLLQATLSDRIRTRRFLLALSLAPLTRILSLMLPLQHLPLIYWYLLVGVPLAIAAIFAARAGIMRRVELGVTLNKLPYQGLIALTGIGLGYLEYRILRPAPLVMELRLETIWLPALILLIFTGLLEEFIFRGLLLSASIRSLGRSGLFYMAVVFAVLHIGYRSWLDIGFVFVVAMFFGKVVLRSGSILGVTIAHGLINIGLFLVFPFVLSTPVVQTPVNPNVNPVAPVMLAPVQSIPTPQPDHPKPALSQPLFLPVAPTVTASITVTASATLTPSLAPTDTPCVPPSGWVPYKVQSGDFIEALSQRYQVEAAEIRLANCLDSESLWPDQVLWLPPLPVEPTAQPTVVPWPTKPRAVVTLTPTRVPTQPSVIDMTPTGTSTLPSIGVISPTATLTIPTFTPTLQVRTLETTSLPTFTVTVLPTESPVPTDTVLPTESPAPTDMVLPTESPAPVETLTPVPQQPEPTIEPSPIESATQEDPFRPTKEHPVKPK